jgi:hypothetical protein
VRLRRTDSGDRLDDVTVHASEDGILGTRDRVLALKFMERGTLAPSAGSLQVGSQRQPSPGKVRTAHDRATDTMGGDGMPHLWQRRLKRLESGGRPLIPARDEGRGSCGRLVAAARLWQRAVPGSTSTMSSVADGSKSRDLAWTLLRQVPPETAWVNPRLAGLHRPARCCSGCLVRVDGSTHVVAPRT